MTSRDQLTIGQTVTITRTLVTTGRITSIQTAGCTHAVTITRNGQRINTSTHPDQPCPDRDTITGVLLADNTTHRRTWIDLEGVPGLTAHIQHTA